jgi:hydroxyacyl-ACP dehydratase HTD2-like protein with hotdog domain
MNQTVNATRCDDIKVGDSLPERSFTPDNVQSMMYNAILWNGHRIHFDEPYAKDIEGYPGLVIAGPCLGDWIHQCLEEWLAEDGRIASIEYSNRIASYVGETLRSGGTVTACNTDTGEVQVEVFIKNEAGEVVTPGLATVQFQHD